MKEIFEKIEGREWDWFNIKFPPEDWGFGKNDNKTLLLLYKERECRTYEFSLADLLANKSWCKAVWGKEWRKRAVWTFLILLVEGEKEAIEDIKRTIE